MLSKVFMLNKNIVELLLCEGDTYICHKEMVPLKPRLKFACLQNPFNDVYNI
jgi:hypothetical protein